jgi:hypothetical protein
MVLARSVPTSSSVPTAPRTELLRLMAPREALASAKVSRAAGRGSHRSVHLFLVSSSPADGNPEDQSDCPAARKHEHAMVGPLRRPWSRPVRGGSSEPVPRTSGFSGCLSRNSRGHHSWMEESNTTAPGPGVPVPVPSGPDLVPEPAPRPDPQPPDVQPSPDPQIPPDPRPPELPPQDPPLGGR